MEYGEWLIGIKRGLLFSIYKMDKMTDEEKDNDPHQAMLKQIVPTVVRPSDL